MPQIVYACAAHQGFRLPIGMNLAGIADWEIGFPFKNLMWGSRMWLTRNAEGESPWDTNLVDSMPMDANGYPLLSPFVVGSGKPQVPFTLLPNRLVPGRYILLHDGDGQIDGLMGTKVVSRSPGRLELEMTHGESLEGIVLSRSTKGDPIRNIRVLAAKDEKADLQKDPFRQELLDFCRPFHCLRFMDWTVTNGSLEKEWGNRKRPGFYTMVGAGGDADAFFGRSPQKSEFLLSGGVSWEICIQLCNVTGIDGWFCIPHRATEDYVRNLAKLIKENLDPKLKAYIEYSNEVWNWGFIQAQWMIRNPEAAADLQKEGLNPWEDSAKSKGTLHPERTGALIRRAFKPFEEVFAGSDSKRLVRVCAGQNTWFDTVERQTRFVMEHGGCDAVSTGGYIGPNDAVYQKWEKAGANLTADQVIADLVALFPSEWMETKRKEAALADRYKLAYLVYEGGQHIQPLNQQEKPYMPALKDAQSHPKMYELYMENLRRHQEVGTDLFCAFSSVGAQGEKYGSWGSMAYYGQPLGQAPKMRALLEANAPRPR